MLRNPAYAGIYARGRKKTVTQLNDQGHVEKKRRRVPVDQWDVFLQGHHEPYISEGTWEHNLQKIATNAGTRQSPSKRSAQNGNGLMVGLLRCRRCGHKLHATYRCGKVSYICRGGAAQRNAASSPACFSFRATRLEERLTELILEVVRPSGIDAAREATERLAARRDQQRQLIMDRRHAAQEAEARAAREYKKTDATYTAVRRQLAQEWDEALSAVETQRTQLAEFDKCGPPSPTPEQHAQLDRLGGDLRRIWNHPRASMIQKKQIVRTLINEIVVDVENATDEIVLMVHWAGGHHTQLRHPRRSRIQPRNVEDIKNAIDTLRKVLDDQTIANVLNREKLWRPKGGKGGTWTARNVTTFRKQHHIPAYSAKSQQDHGWLTQAQAANRLQISTMSMTRLVKTGIIPAQQPQAGLPTVVKQKDLDLDHVKSAVVRLKASPHRPLTADPNQLCLLPI